MNKYTNKNPFVKKHIIAIFIPPKDNQSSCIVRPLNKYTHQCLDFYRILTYNLKQ